MCELVPLALMLQRLAGGPDHALAWADSIAAKGQYALPLLGLDGDAALVVKRKGTEGGIVRRPAGSAARSPSALTSPASRFVQRVGDLAAPGSPADAGPGGLGRQHPMPLLANPAAPA